MKALLFSDLHYTLDRQIHGRWPAESLRRAIVHARDHHGDADCCVILGDLTDSRSESEYQGLADDLGALPFPHRIMLGNHDDRKNFVRVFGTDVIDDSGYVQSVMDVGPYRFVLLDTHTPGQEWGTLDGGRLLWLDTALARSDRPCVICLHHPPIPTALPAFDRIGLREPEAFEAIVEKHRAVVRQILSGHCHMPIGGNLAGITIFGVTSLLYQALPNFCDDRFLDGPGLTAAYGLAVADESHFTIHTVPFEYTGDIVSSGEQP